MALSCWEHLRALTLTTLSNGPHSCRHADSTDHSRSRAHPTADEFMRWVPMSEAQCRNPNCRQKFCVFLHIAAGSVGGLADVLHQNLVYARRQQQFPQRIPLHFAFVVGSWSALLLQLTSWTDSCLTTIFCSQSPRPGSVWSSLQSKTSVSSALSAR